jgi:hypothetical protein
MDMMVVCYPGPVEPWLRLLTMIFCAELSFVACASYFYVPSIHARYGYFSCQYHSIL